ncbi:MAG TPA: SRPBCC family protein [Gemmatimonadaceae bacterium]|nr:SRPBCC family protein [Gemmatimonadaceae bacterium]
MTESSIIRKQVVLRAPKSRVWRAISDAAEFGQWFGMKLDGPFKPGRSVKGKLSAKGYEHLTLEMSVERIHPEDFFSYRWHPFAIDPNVDYSKEPMTLVEFTLADAPEGTTLTIVESGFEKIPASRRDEAFRMNDNGWSSQVKNIERYVAG